MFNIVEESHQRQTEGLCHFCCLMLILFCLRNIDSIHLHSPTLIAYCN